MSRPRSPVKKDAGVLLNNGVTQPHSVPAFPALTNPFVPLKVIVISADLSQKPGWKNKLLHRKLTFFEPFQHPATDSRHTILCTKCHLSYYKFSAEYSADPKGLRTKRAHRQGHFWNAMRELPQSFLMRGFCTDAGLPRPGHGQLRSLTTKMPAGVFLCPACAAWSISLQEEVCLPEWHQVTCNFWATLT